eukprot:TRINITY_DN3861_c0_g1_i1.p1 TRINITY_DN3861_c0_g1~~TRINITY_DN3861_c0_g1_i1.p1  ORF type:complete len:246 (+),score=1.94 TRINITY_DN3861_c0_g1_i1:87-740(+)
MSARCDGCGQNPITGIRYKCGHCADFDYCERCETNSMANHDKTHCFIKIRNPALKVPTQEKLLRPFPVDFNAAAAPQPYPPAQQAPWPAQGGYPPGPGPNANQTGYPPAPSSYPSQSQPYPPSAPQSGYPSQPGGYPPSQPGGYPPSQPGGYPPAQNAPFPGPPASAPYGNTPGNFTAPAPQGQYGSGGGGGSHIPQPPYPNAKYCYTCAAYACGRH